MHTHFSFELYYAASSPCKPAERNAVMQQLGPSLQAALASHDGSATVTASDSHKGSDNQLVEVVSSLPDASIAALLKTFCDTNGLTLNLLE